MGIMDRTVPSFRIALAMEEREWNKPFRNALDRSDTKKKFLLRCCLTLLGFTSLSFPSYDIQPVRFYPILLTSILLYCYKQLIECAKQVEQIMVAIGIGKEEVYHYNEPVSN